MKRSIVSPGFVKRTLAKLLKLDQQLGIVVDGNVASKAIAVGKYVNLINSTITGKQDGIYVATGAVSKNGTVTAADISGNAVTEGVTNYLSEQIGKIGNKATSWTMEVNRTLTTSYTEYATYQSRKFSDHGMLVFTPMVDSNWMTNSVIVPSSAFIGGRNITVMLNNGSIVAEVDVKYKSDTSYEAKYVGTVGTAPVMNIYGIL